MVKDFRSLQERLRQRLLAEISAGELTGLQLARQTGFQQAHISNFLNRKRGLSLEAMDEILKARGLSVTELAATGEDGLSSATIIHAADAGFTFIPLLEAEKCLASDVPLSGARDTLQVMTSRLQKLPVRMHIPRPHWQRFVAVRVRATDAHAMAPRLPRGSLVVIDRHSNEVADGAIYLARAGNKVVLRHIENIAGTLVLRPANIAHPLQQLESPSAVVGRACLLLSEM
jgi:hypothetical protein